MYLLNNEIIFPPVEYADEDGLLAVGGDLSTARLINAYRNGIFPWYNADEPICWWSPDPRCVLLPGKLIVSKSMQRVLRSNEFSFTINQDFERVIRSCKNVQRKRTNGTWINEEMIGAYVKLNKLGYGISAEAWQNGNLVGGLYGIKINKVFFGESMFSLVSNASKFAFIKFVQHLQRENVQLIDCQQKTPHLLSLGAEMIERDLFIKMLDEYC